MTWTSRTKFEISKFVHFSKIIQKIIVTTSKFIFFKFLAFFQPVMVVPLLQKQQRKNSLNYRNFTKPYPWNIESLKTLALWPRLVAFETKKRPETFKTETKTRTNALKTKTKSWDSITANNSNKLVESTKLLNLLTWKNCNLLWSNIFSWLTLWSTCMVQTIRQQWNFSQQQPHVV